MSRNNLVALVITLGGILRHISQSLYKNLRQLLSSPVVGHMLFVPDIPMPPLELSGKKALPDLASLVVLAPTKHLRLRPDTLNN